MNNNGMIENLIDHCHIEKGDTILVASDTFNLMNNALKEGKKLDLNDIIDTLKNRIGSEGNVLFPTYNWRFCHGVTWNYHKTRSRTGLLGQLALERKDFIRTRHPIYSFAVWGKDSKRLYEMDNINSFVGDTPFDFLCKTKNSKMICIDVDLNQCFTFGHYVEECFHVPYRFLKKFTGQYIDENNNESTRTYTMYVRYLDRKIIPNTPPPGLETRLFEASKMYKEELEGFVENIIVRSLRFKDAYDMLASDFERGIYPKVIPLD